MVITTSISQGSCWELNATVMQNHNGCIVDFNMLSAPYPQGCPRSMAFDVSVLGYTSTVLTYINGVDAHVCSYQ